MQTIIQALNKSIALAKEQIYKAFEQLAKEVLDLKNRTSKGIITAKINGKSIGRPAWSKIETAKAKEIKQIILKYSKDFNGEFKNIECIKLANNVSRNSYYKYKSEF